MKEKEFNVLSLFDGCSGGQQALDRLCIKVDNYYASEIDKYAMQVTMANYPNTIQLGSVVDVDVSKLKHINLLCGGSPCQSFSFAGKRKGMSTKDNIEILTLEHYLELKEQKFEFEGQSYLFWEYIRILTDIRKYNPDVKFLLENVMMGEKWQKILTRAIGINPIEINSALVSAQNRRRLYWTNIGAEQDGLFGDLKCMIPQPKDRGILLKDILEPEVDEKYYLSDKITGRFKLQSKGDNIVGSTKGEENTRLGQRDEVYGLEGKMGCLNATDYKQPKQIQIVAMGGRNPENTSDRTKGCPTKQMLEAREDGKTNCITTVQKDNLVYSYRQDTPIKEDSDKYQTLRHNPGGKTRGVELELNTSRIRRLTPLECERLQTMKDGYTAHVSDSQRYKMIGNGWTTEVIAHIFSYLNK